MNGDGPREQLDQVARFKQHVGVPRLARGLDRHGTLDEVELAADAVGLERLRHQRPHLTQVLLAVLREQRRERGLLDRRRQRVVGRHGVDLPVVDGAIVPALLVLARRMQVRELALARTGVVAVRTTGVVG